MRKALFGIITLTLAMVLLLFPARPGRAVENPLQSPLGGEVLARSHLYKADEKEGLWACYNLVVPDQDLLALSREEAAGLLLAAYESAPGRAGYESAWVELRAVSGGDTVFGKVHGSKSKPPLTDLSMFGANQTVFSVSLRARKAIVEDLGGVIDDLVGFIKEKMKENFKLSKPKRPGEIEL